MTKQFIIKKIKLQNKPANSSLGKNRSRSSFDYENHFSNIKKQIISDKGKSSKISKGALSKISFKIEWINL